MTTGDEASQGTTAHAAVAFTDAQLSEAVADRLAAVEARLHERLGAGEDFLADRVLHLVNAGGKRFRPMFCALAAQFGPHPDAEGVTAAASVVEMIHLATLYHDDVMDEAPKRRGVESANARWSNSVAILAGDYLFAVASAEMATMGQQSIALIAETFGKLVTGQMRETVGDDSLRTGDVDRAIAHYLTVIEEKTGCLIEVAGKLGAIHAGAAEEHVAAIGRFGAVMGQIFQILDDIIDVQSETEQSGKTPGTDIREGVFTLPVLYALQEDSPAAVELAGLLTGPVDEDAAVARALELIAQTQGRQRALDYVADLCAQAREQLALLPDNSARAALAELLEFSIQRAG